MEDCREAGRYEFFGVARIQRCISRQRHRQVVSGVVVPRQRTFSGWGAAGRRPPRRLMKDSGSRRGCGTRHTRFFSVPKERLNRIDREKSLADRKGSFQYVRPLETDDIIAFRHTRRPLENKSGKLMRAEGALEQGRA